MMKARVKWLFSARSPGSPALPPGPSTNGFFTVIAAWAILTAGLVSLASQNLSVPGLYYDEAVFAGMAKDFLTGHTHGHHMPETEVISLFGRPFPVFVQKYLGAVKSWLYLPAFAIFGATAPILRLTTLGYSLAGLLLLMLWLWRWLGTGTALLAGTFLAFDPAFFFLSVLDWGSVVPSFLCRFAGCYLGWLWWRHCKAHYAFFAAFLFGVGFLNKIDFAVFLAGLGLAAACCYGRPLWAALRERPAAILLAGVGFLLGAGPILLKLPAILKSELPPATPGGAGEWPEKFSTLLAMYDGSYFYRLMAAGGMFRTMFQGTAGVWAPLGIAVVVTVIFLCVSLIRGGLPSSTRRTAAFLLLATVLVTLGALLLPGGVRIHHSVLVFPLPHLVVAVALVLLWHRFPGASAAHRAARGVLSVAVALLLLGQFLAVHKTQRLIRESGGQGWWCESLNTFCNQVKDRANLTIVSLDWGFNEQLLFLTEGPTLLEPCWSGQDVAASEIAASTNRLYLFHPPEYRLIDIGRQLLDPGVLAANHLEAQPYADRQGRVAFYVIRPRQR